MTRFLSVLVFGLLLFVMIAQEARSGVPFSSGDAPANPSRAPDHSPYPLPAKNPAVTKLSDIAKGMEWIGPAVSEPGIPGAGLLWISDNPEMFKLADAQIGFLDSDVYDKHIDLAKVRRLAGRDFKFERPGILMLNGKPAYFYAASGINLSGGDTPESYVMKINVE